MMIALQETVIAKPKENVIKEKFHLDFSHKIDKAFPKPHIEMTTKGDLVKSKIIEVALAVWRPDDLSL